MNSLNWKCIFTTIIFSSAFSLLSAQTVALEETYRQIDTVISERSLEGVENVLAANRNNQSYPQIESYTLRKTRQLIIVNDLLFARDVSLAVIDQNLDNFEAVDLYTSINQTIEKQEAIRVAAEERRQVEEIKQQAAEAKVKSDIRREYTIVTNVSTGETVYLDHAFNERYIPFAWDVSLGMMNLGLNFVGSDFSLKYGIALSGFFFFYSESVTIGGELFTDILVLTFLGEQYVPCQIKFVPSIGLPKFNSWLFGRIGFSAINSKTALPGNTDMFLTPVVGLGLRDIHALDIFMIDAYLDYFPGHFAYKGIYAAFEVGANATMVVAEFNKVDINFKFGLKNTTFIENSGVNNQTRILLSIGVGKNE
ncbi:MAG: hypothetical protein LBR47_04075 [Spirochaetaceae bacterium]|jgi:hypothetical protein|nr:hypothetical protein [Spirochaetaceae bacterium]